MSIGSQVVSEMPDGFFEKTRELTLTENPEVAFF